MSELLITREQILQMQAGRCLDGLVAIHVFGRADVECDFVNGGISCDCDKRLPALYSASIADAWLVVEKMKEHHDFRLICQNSMAWTCEFSRASEEFLTYEPTAPLAICRASLLATLNNERTK